MAVSVDATPAGAAANSYVTLAEADAYFAVRSHSEAWTGELDDDTRRRALITACNQLEVALQWVGYPTTTTQRLGMPRVGLRVRNGNADYASDVVPQPIKDLQCEQALVVLAGDRTTESTTGGLKRAQADVVEVEFFEGATFTTPRVLAPWVWEMAEPWIYNGEPGPVGLQVVDMVRV